MENHNLISNGGSAPAPDTQMYIELMKEVDQIGDTNLPVLLTGATGAGKALVASAIHYRSSRREQPFIAVNCATIPAHMVQTELLEHFASANGGTVFLDEITGTPASFQETLLEALQTQHGDVRVIAASSCNVEQAVAEGRFSNDLFEYLNATSIVFPPARTESANNDWVTLSVIEGRYVARVLEHTCGNKQAAARLLAVDRKTLDRMIKRHHIDSQHVKALRAKASART